MASGITSPLGIFAIVLLIIGIIMAIVGIIFVIARQNQTKDWWIWTLLIGGLVLAIFGGILLAVAMASNESKVEPVEMVDACAPRIMAPVPYQAPAQFCGAPPAYDYHNHHSSHHSAYYPAPVPAAIPQLSTAPAYNYHPAPQYYAAPVPRAAPPPPANYTNVHPVGQASFDPDPQTVTQRYQPSPQRVIATGPYGPNGEPVDVPGTYIPPAVEVDHTYDYPRHNVKVNGATYPNNVYAS